MYSSAACPLCTADDYDTVVTACVVCNVSDIDSRYKHDIKYWLILEKHPQWKSES